LIVGIDIGTQSLKAIVCDGDLALRGKASRGYEVAAPRPGWAEQQPQQWEAALAPAIGDALAAAGVPAEAVVAVGIAGQLDGCVPVDAAGAALGPALIWMDRRAVAAMPALDPDWFRARTGLVADPGHMAAKIRWLKDSGIAAARFHQPVSYLVERLTGAAVLDHGHASTTMLYALAARDWDAELLDRFGVEAGELPAIAEATAVAGALTAVGSALTGLPAGIPVAVGTGDDFATPLGAGITRPGSLACVLGTAEVVGAVSRELVLDHRGLLETHGYASGYFIENPGWLSGGALEWLCGIAGFASAAALDAAAAEAATGAGGVTFLPALTGAMAPAWVPGARGCFYGLSAATGRGELARAVLEGCAFAMNDVAGRLGDIGVGLEEIVLLGGGSASDLWARIRADVSGLPVAAASQLESCPLGAAALAAVAAGVAPDLETATAPLAARRARRDPDPAATAASAAAYARYLDLFAALEPLYE
jgi:xylulokinase